MAATCQVNCILYSIWYQLAEPFSWTCEYILPGQVHICWSLMKLSSIKIGVAATLNLQLTCEMLCLSYSCKAGCQMWGGSARIPLTNRGESKKYWLLMVLVILLKWVHIFIWSTALKTQPNPKPNQPTKKTKPQPPPTKQNIKTLPVVHPSHFWKIFVKRCYESPGNLKSHKGVENRCRVLVNEVVKSFCFHIHRTCKPTAGLLLPSLLPPSPSCYRLSNSSFSRTANRDKFDGCNYSW